MSKGNHSRGDSRPPMAARGRRRRGNGVLIAALLALLAVIAALDWLAEHLALFAVVALTAAWRDRLPTIIHNLARPVS